MEGKEKIIKKNDIDFAIINLEEGRWRLKGLARSEGYPENIIKKFQDLHDRICDLEDELKDYEQ